MKIHTKDLTNDFKFISKKDEWFKEGTEVQLEDNCGYAGLFRGIIEITRGSHGNYWDKLLIGHDVDILEREDSELCLWDEFDIYSPDGNLIEIVEE